MKKLIFAVFFLYLHSVPEAGNCIVKPASTFISDSIPLKLSGDFMDDYGVHYHIEENLWLQYPNAKYHILKWNTEKQYIIAVNDADNASEGGLYTRIDYIFFDNMAPYTSGFCYTVYNAATDSIAEADAGADRQNPKMGCNGFPFSRLKKNN